MSKILIFCISLLSCNWKYCFRAFCGFSYFVEVLQGDWVLIRKTDLRRMVIFELTDLQTILKDTIRISANSKTDILRGNKNSLWAAGLPIHATLKIEELQSGYVSWLYRCLIQTDPEPFLHLTNTSERIYVSE